MNEVEVLRGALAAWGEDAEVDMLYEEVGELLAVAHQAKRGRKNLADVAEEVADVSIIVPQIIIMLGKPWSGWPKVDQSKPMGLRELAAAAGATLEATARWQNAPPMPWRANARDDLFDSRLLAALNHFLVTLAHVRLRVGPAAVDAYRVEKLARLAQRVANPTKHYGVEARTLG